MLMPKGRLIVCCGLRRSGSTWLFNVIRTAIEQAGVPMESRFVNSDEQDIVWAASPTTKYRVIKSHKFSKHTATAASKLFMTYRDFRDVVASCMRKNKLNNGRYQVTRDGGGTIDFSDVQEVKEFLAAEVRNYKSWSHYTDMIIPYRQVISNKTKVVQDVAKHLGVAIDPQVVIDRVSHMEIPDVPNPVTQFRPNHITDGRVGNYSIIPHEILEMIEGEFDGFIED